MVRFGPTSDHLGTSDVSRDFIIHSHRLPRLIECEHTRLAYIQGWDQAIQVWIFTEFKLDAFLISRTLQSTSSSYLTQYPACDSLLKPIVCRITCFINCFRLGQWPQQSASVVLCNMRVSPLRDRKEKSLGALSDFEPLFSFINQFLVRYILTEL